MRIRIFSALAALSLASLLHAESVRPDSSTYFEFGTVVSISERSIEVQTFDGQKRSVQHSYVLTADSRADVVRPGDQVEVIYTPSATGELTLRRLLVLYAGIPKAGPPPPFSHAAQRAHTAPALSTTPAPRTARGETPVHLGVDNAPKPAPILAVPLGNAAVAKPIVPVAIAHPKPAEECNRSSADWPSQPLSIAVIDFRYPTEKEESHDLARTGGGSGTAVADLVFARLNDIQTGFAIDRGDRRRLDRTDFAGAARLGRQLGVDAVLAGTFAPVEESTPDEFGSPRPKSYQLHAGLVDTCTGQLLMRLSSDSCPSGSACDATVSAKEAENPEAHRPAFTAPIDTLLYPLEHNATPPAASGIVTSTAGDVATLQLPSGISLKPGDQVAIHASRLTKNPSTYTLQDLHDEEIGRVSIQSLKGSAATGTFIGDIPPHPGDTVKLILNNSSQTD